MTFANSHSIDLSRWRCAIATVVLGTTAALGACYLPPPGNSVPDTRVREAELQVRHAIENELSIKVDAIPTGALLMAYHLVAVMTFPWARVERPTTEVQV